MLNIGVITLFPECFSALDAGITGRALTNKKIGLQCWNPRDYSELKHRQVDDRPYGGGPGMVLAVQPLRDAIKAAKAALGDKTKTIYVSAQGQRLTHKNVARLSQENNLLFVAGRYEGIDERLIDSEIDEVWSIGDYVLTGGELPVMVMIDAVTRLLPGVLGDEESAVQDSFVNGLLDCAHYTRPETIDGVSTPEVLLNGDHRAIEKWRHENALYKTWRYRPDLLEGLTLTEEDKTLISEFKESDGNPDELRN